MTSETSTPETPMTRAGEYVLGTLAGAECEAFRAALATDPQLQAEVREWERRLAPLAGAISPESPSPAVWSAIESRLAAGKAAPADDSGGGQGSDRRGCPSSSPVGRVLARRRGRGRGAGGGPDPVHRLGGRWPAAGAWGRNMSPW